MRKNRILLVACALAAFAFLTTSCKKNEEKASAIVSTSALEADDEDRVYLDFGDRNRMKWNGGDKIKVYNFNLDAPRKTEVVEWEAGPEAEGEAIAYFEGPCVSHPQSPAGYHFIYPAEMVNGSNSLDNSTTFTIGDTQQYTELVNKNGYRITTIQPGAMLQWAQSENKDFTMQNLFGIARVYMTGSKTVAKVEIIDSYLALTGTAEISLPNFDYGVFQTLFNDYKQGNIAYIDCFEYAYDNFNYRPHPTGNKVTLNCAYTFNGESFDGVKLTNPDAKSFMFCLRPGALSQGFTVKVYFTDHTGRIIDMYANTDNLPNPRKYCIVPGRIQAIKFLDADGFFIDVDGIDANGDPIFTPFEW